MVKLSTTVYCLIATLAIPGLAATVGDLTAAITDVVAKVTAQDAQLNTVPTGSAATIDVATKLVGDAQDVVTSINEVTIIVNMLSAADITPVAPAILTQLQGIEPNAASALNSLAAKKSAFAKLPESNTIISFTLNSLDTSLVNVEKAFMGKTPANLASQIQSLRTNLNTAYTNAINAYSN